MEDLIDQVYRNAFVFIKPNELGGNSAMWELAHMGRRTIGSGMYEAPNLLDARLKYGRHGWKGLFRTRKGDANYPTKGVVGYEDLDAVVRLIEKEAEHIGRVNEKLIEETRGLFRTIPWKRMDFWR